MQNVNIFTNTSVEEQPNTNVENKHCRDDSRQNVDNKQETVSSFASAQTDFVDKNKLHIVLVTETWLPDVNGVSMSLNNLMNTLNEMGHKISLIHPKIKSTKLIDDKSTTDVYKITPLQHDVEVRGLPIPKYSDLQFGLPNYTLISRELKEIQPDIVHIATEGPLGFAALVAAKRLKIAATTGYHTQFHDFSKHFGLGLVASPLMGYFRKFHNWSLATCVPSQKTENDLEKLGFKNLYKVGRGVDIVGFNPDKRCEELRSQWNALSHHTVLVMVSRLSPEKGVDLVIKAFKNLQVQQINRVVKLIIVGDGPDRQRLEAMSDDNEDIIFAGMQRGDDLAKHYASGDAFVFASQVETFGNVVTEAMASGLAVFAFNDAAAGMLVDDATGQLTEVEDENGFVNMVADLPKLQQLNLQGVNARNKVEQLSWGVPAKQMLQMFYDAIDVVNKK